MNAAATALGTGNVKAINDAIEVVAPSIAGVSSEEMLGAIQSSDEEPDEVLGERMERPTQPHQLQR